MKTSAVIMSRNDNYGGNLKERATICLLSMLDTFDEVIYVDWNSPKKSLLDEIKTTLPKTGRLKHIIVTPEQHKQFTNNDPDAQECCEVLGRNVGIKRATGDIIVSTNIDIIPPSREMLTFFLEHLFNPVVFYTFARRGVKLEIAHREFITTKQVQGIRDMFVYNRHNIPIAGFERFWSIVAGCGDFQLASKDIWEEIRGFEESYIYRGVADVHTQMKAVAHGFAIQGVVDFPVFHIEHGSGNSFHLKRNPQFGFKLKKEKTYNKKEWGFPKDKFTEEVI